MAAYRPAERKTDVAPEKLYAAAEGALLDHGYLIAKRDPERFRLETEERRLAGSDISQDKYHYVWIIEAGGGALKVRVTCQRQSGGEFEDCRDKRPEKLVTEQDQLIEAILGEAGAK